MAQPDPEPILGKNESVGFNAFVTILEKLLNRRGLTLYSLCPTDVDYRERIGKPRPIHISAGSIHRLVWSKKHAGNYPTLRIEALKKIVETCHFAARERQELIAALLVTAVQQHLVTLWPKGKAPDTVPFAEIAQKIYYPLLAIVQEAGLNPFEENAGGMMTEQDAARYELNRALAAYDEAVMILNFLELPSLVEHSPQTSLLPEWLSSGERLERLVQARDACLHARSELEFLGEPRDADWQTWLVEVNQTLDHVNGAIAQLQAALPPSSHQEL